MSKTSGGVAALSTCGAEICKTRSEDSIEENGKSEVGRDVYTLPD